MRYLWKHFFGVKKKKIKNGMIAKSKGPNISAMFAALLLLTEGYGTITR